MKNLSQKQLEVVKKQNELERSKNENKELEAQLATLKTEKDELDAFKTAEFLKKQKELEITKGL